MDVGIIANGFDLDAEPALCEALSLEPRLGKMAQNPMRAK